MMPREGRARLLTVNARGRPHATLPEIGDALSACEERVMDALCAGLTCTAIAGRLDRSPNTVKNHLQAAYRKLGTGNRISAALRWRGAARPVPAYAPPALERPLTPREQDVLAVLCSGGTHRAMGRCLGCVPDTVKIHLYHAYAKLAVSGGVQAALVWHAQTCPGMCAWCAPVPDGGSVPGPAVGEARPSSNSPLPVQE